VALLLFHLGCAGNVRSLQYTSDLLDRVAIEHNKNFKPTYVECQTILNDLAIELQLNPPTEMALNIKVLQGKNKLKRCSKELQRDWDRLGKRISIFQSATERFE